jgi:hypothetical protein
MPVADDFLPESRARETRGVVRHNALGNLIPIFCANCGKEWGMVPEHHVTFAFALCDPCAEKHGDVAHLYKEPDEVFWERVRNAEAEEGVTLTPELLTKQLEDPSSVFAKLAVEWDKHVRKF